MRVLVVDDDRDVCQTIADLVSMQQCQVTMAHSVDEALAILRGQSFDLVLTDYRIAKQRRFSFISEAGLLILKFL